MADVGETIRDVILRITGDGDDARRELERLSLDLTKFGHKDAEANAKIDTAKAKEDLRALEAAFTKVDGRDLNATANVRLGQAMAELAVLQAELDHLDNDDVTIDVNVRKDLEERLQSLGIKAAGFADNLESVSKKGQGVGDALDSTNVQMGFFSSKASNILKLLPLLIPLLTAVVSAVVAVGASAVQAVAGLGALAVAMGGALVAAAAIGAAAFFRFKETMETAGTPAYKIVQVVGKIGEALSGLSRAADPILHAIADNLGGVFDVLAKVTPAFFDLGKKAGQAVGWMVNALTSSGMADGISKLLELAGPVMMPLVQIMVRFSRVLLNIANATMPFLTKALQGLAGWLGEVVKGTSDMGKTRGVIGVLIGQLGSWWNLLVQVAGVFKELVTIAAPFGKGIVDALAKGAEHLKEWLSSSEGTERVQTFFKETLPVAAQLAKVFAQLVIIVLQFGQLMSPIITVVLAGFNAILGVVRGVMETIINLDRALAFKNWGPLLDSAIATVSGWKDKLVDLIRGGFDAILNFTGNAWGSIKEAISTQLQSSREAVANTVNSMREVATKVWQSIREAAGNIFGAVRQVIANQLQSGREAVANTVNGMREVATNVWQSIREAAGNIFGAVRTAIANALQAARDAVGNAVNGMREVATNVWQAIRDAAASIFGNVKDAIGNALNGAKDVVSNAVSGMLSSITGAAGRFFSAGVALIDNLINGFTSKVADLYNTVKGAVDKVTSLLPGSEPKDPSSPLRNLGRRGRAIIGNLVDGIREAGPDLVKAVSDEIAGIATVGPPGLAAGATSASGAPGGGVQAAIQRVAAAGVGAAAGGGGLNIENLNVVPMAGGGSPDPDVLAAQLTMALRARAAAS